MSTPIHFEEPARLSQQDFNQFANLSGDHNPIHVDPDYSSGTRFGATVSHGMLLFTKLRGCLHRHFPKHRLAEQQLMFPAPAYAEENLLIQLDSAPTQDKGPLSVATRILKADGSACLEGRCILEPDTGNAP
ncbi:MAG: hypothetical protein MI794_20865 [Pseudomonadales bacterium]|nr:hypothetical protein [Pseudomonadales bacterium]